MLKSILNSLFSEKIHNLVPRAIPADGISRKLLISRAVGSTISTLEFRRRLKSQRPSFSKHMILQGSEVEKLMFSPNM